MLDLAATQKIKSWIQPIPLSAEGCSKAVQSVHDNEVRYRHVLTDYDDQFGKRA